MISFYIIVSIFMVNCAFNNLSVCFNLYINIFNFITLTPSTAACTLLLLCLSFFKSLSYFQHDPFIMYYHHYSSVLIFKRSWTLRLEAFYFTSLVRSATLPCCSTKLHWCFSEVYVWLEGSIFDPLPPEVPLFSTEPVNND